MGTRRQFSREFKFEAVKLVKERGVSVPQAARDSALTSIAPSLRFRKRWPRPRESKPVRKHLGLQ